MIVTEKWAAFIQSGVSVVVGTRDGKNTPQVVRGLGARVSADRSRVTIIVAKSQAEGFLTALRGTRAIAVVFSQPSTHTTIQLKAMDAALGRVLASDASLVDRQRDGFVADACSLGYSEMGIRTLLWCEPDDLAAITFSPQSAFQQTPGPHAGEPLED